MEKKIKLYMYCHLEENNVPLYELIKMIRPANKDVFAVVIDAYACVRTFCHFFSYDSQRSIIDELMLKRPCQQQRPCQNVASIFSSPEPKAHRCAYSMLSRPSLAFCPQCSNVFSSETAGPVKLHVGYP